MDDKLERLKEDIDDSERNAILKSLTESIRVMTKSLINRGAKMSGRYEATREGYGEWWRVYERR